MFIFSSQTGLNGYKHCNINTGKENQIVDEKYEQPKLVDKMKSKMKEGMLTMKTTATNKKCLNLQMNFMTTFSK